MLAIVGGCLPAHRRLLRIFAQCRQLPQGQIQLVQAVYQPQALGIAVKHQQILAKIGPLRAGRLAQRSGKQAVQLLRQPLAHHLLAKVAERRVADVVQQAGHLHQIDEGPLAHSACRQGR